MRQALSAKKDTRNCLKRTVDRRRNTSGGTGKYRNVGRSSESVKTYESTPLTSGTTLAELIRRPELSYEKLAPIDKNRKNLPEDVAQQVDINIKYDGYIKRQMRQVEQFKKLENKKDTGRYKL